MMDKPKIIVICGSSKFVDIMAVVAWLLERDEGAIALGLHLLPWWYATKEEVPDHLAEHEGVAAQMDELHLRKIDIADEVFVVNFDDYIGESTRREIEYSQGQGKTLRWLTHDPIGLAVLSLLTNHTRSDSKLDKLARYLINNFGDIVRVDDLSNEDAVDEAIRILEIYRKGFFEKAFRKRFKE
jgi:hypothetical protein